MGSFLIVAASVALLLSVGSVDAYGQYNRTDFMQTVVPPGAGVVPVGENSARLGPNTTCFLSLLTTGPVNDGTVGREFLCIGDSVALTGRCPNNSKLQVVLAGGGCASNQPVSFLGGYNNGIDSYTCTWKATTGVGPQQCCPDNTCSYINNLPSVSVVGTDATRRATSSITFTVTAICCYSF